MSGFNLPPGCSVSDIPGNTPEDEKWERLMDAINDSRLTADEAWERWNGNDALLSQRYALIAAAKKLIDEAERVTEAAREDGKYLVHLTAAVNEMLAAIRWEPK